MPKLGRPLWFDENTVPRTLSSPPHYLANIHADEAPPLHIGCQGCDTPFIVAMLNRYPVLSTGIGDNTISYGDPPNVNCSNASMSSAALQVLQYWNRLQGQRQRHPEREAAIRPGWMSAKEQQRRRGSKQPPNSNCG